MNLVELDQALRKLRLSGMADVLETRLQGALPDASPRGLPRLRTLAASLAGALRRP